MLFRLHLFVLATLFGTCVRAQVLSPGPSPGERGVYDIQATVTFADGYRPGGNVAILHPTDSSLLGGDFFLDGEILLPGREEPELLLRFTSLEFADRYLVVRYDGQPTLDLGVLEMRPAELALDAITVRARKPVYTQRADGSVEVLVAGSVLAASSSTTEILSKSPDVQIDEDGALSVVGRGAALLYLDGQPITAEQLTLVAPANIQKITVIRNPSARYEASGGAVIEITTRRGREDGYRGQFIQNLGHSAFGGEQGFSSLTASLNHGRFSANAGYSLLYGRDRHVKHTTRNRTDPAVFLSSDLRTDWQPQLAPHANHNLGLQYTAPGGGYLSLAYAATTERTRGNTFNTNRLEDAEGVLDYASDIARNETNRVRSLSLNFGQDLDSLGSRLFVGGQYVRYANGGDNPIREDGRTPGGPTLRWLRNLIDVDINVASAQVDYTKVFPSGIRLESGLRHAEVDNRSDLDFLLSADNVTFTESEALSSLYRYREGVSATYANLNGRLGERLSYGLGLRAELTDYRLQLSETDDDELTNRYLNLFPNASLLWSLPDGKSLNLAYVARVNRPPFRSLNPNLIYQDPYTSIQGNPELVPERTHAVELTGRSGPFSLKLGYTYTDAPLGGSALPGSTPRSYVLKRLNFSEAHAWYAGLTHTAGNDWWSATTTLSVTREQIYAYEFDFRPVPPRPQPYLFTNQRFTLGKLAKLEALFYYAGELREGTFTRYDYANLTLTLEKAVLQERLVVRLTANDLFNTVRASGDYRQGETDIYFDNKWRSNYFRVSLQYDFGKLREVRYRNEGTGRAERRRAG